MSTTTTTDLPTDDCIVKDLLDALSQIFENTILVPPGLVATVYEPPMLNGADPDYLYYKTNLQIDAATVAVAYYGLPRDWFQETLSKAQRAQVVSALHQAFIDIMVSIETTVYEPQMLPYQPDFFIADFDEKDINEAEDPAPTEELGFGARLLLDFATSGQQSIPIEHRATLIEDDFEECA